MGGLGMEVASWLWGLWAAYWVISGFGGKRTVRRESALSGLRHWVPLACAVWLMNVPDRRIGELARMPLPPTPLLYWLGVVLLVAGVALSIWSRRILGRNWSGTVTLKEDHELIRSGPYRHVRHPIYSGLLLAVLGTALMLDEWRGYVALLLVLIALIPKARLEESWMEELFGDAYARYRAETAALVPGVW